MAESIGVRDASDNVRARLGAQGDGNYGLRIWDGTGALKFDLTDGSSSLVSTASGNYTPTLTASTTSPTLGTGAVAEARYVVIGSLVYCYGHIIFGSSGVNAGSGQYRVSLPAAYPLRPTLYSAIRMSGQFEGYDSSANSRRFGEVQYDGSGTGYVRMLFDGTTGAGSNSAPWTWAANDEIEWAFTYEWA